MRAFVHSNTETMLDHLIWASRVGLCSLTSKCLSSRCESKQLVTELFRRASLNQLLAESKKAMEAMTPEQRVEMFAKQRESWSRQDKD